MKFKKTHTLLVAFLMLFVTNSFSQKGYYRIQNGFGIMGALTQFDIKTDNFETKAENGWMASASATVDIPNKWYNISYAMQLSENRISIMGNSLPLAQSEEVTYKMFAAQVTLLMHVKTFGSYLTFDVGPMLQYNDRLIIDDKDQENFIISNYSNLLAKDISEISKFNFNGTLGLTAGFESIKLRAHYIYGFTNILNKLNSKDLDTTGGESNFKGNQSMLVFGAMFTF